ncbi:hypothetical protein E2C01_043873 [Portunus trituberculatus]|uniref:Uncharacterized protein n=1 Tax=Portunus trituberculatus TaxID=210409 RepID=A0A5B7FRE9_PORTR|nr:hypothetical protein [Portunus trituberculatus]
MCFGTTGGCIVSPQLLSTTGCLQTAPVYTIPYRRREVVTGATMLYTTVREATHPSPAATQGAEQRANHPCAVLLVVMLYIPDHVGRAGGRAETAPQFMRNQQESIHAHFDVPRLVYRQRRRRTTSSNKPKLCLTRIAEPLCISSLIDKKAVSVKKFNLNILFRVVMNMLIGIFYNDCPFGSNFRGKQWLEFS